MLYSLYQFLKKGTLYTLYYMHLKNCMEDSIFASNTSNGNKSHNENCWDKYCYREFQILTYIPPMANAPLW